MKIAFLSNYFSHHQKPLSDAFDSLTNGGYSFISSSSMEEERRQMGWGRGQQPHYIYDMSNVDARFRLDDADVVIAGSAPEDMVQSCIRNGKVVFRYSERPLKNGPEPWKYLPRLLRWHHRNPAQAPLYLLSASAFAAGDYARFGLFRDRAYRWGYFPEVDMGKAVRIGSSDAGLVSILWCGRFLDWKHPEVAVELARHLRDVGVGFRMELIGVGPEEQILKEAVERHRLSNSVSIIGPLLPDEVRARMRSADVFLFTSDRREGWGAVLNEAMSCGCAVLASDAAGSVPYLVNNGQNGFAYQFGNRDDLFDKAEKLVANRELQSRLGEAARNTIAETWNAEVAAERFVAIAQEILDGHSSPELFDDEGPCSRAPVIRESWLYGKA